MTFLIGFAVFAIAVLAFRTLLGWFVVGLLIYILVSLAGQDYREANPPTNVNIISYQELRNYPVDCNKKEEQLAQLYAIQRALNFNPDPDKLSDSDADYDSRLKATIWYYYYGCEK